jgi:type 1 glutamine amidotransferase
MRIPTLILLAALASRGHSAEPIKALLVIGGCCHDYAKQKELITRGISARANVRWTIAYDSDKGTKKLNPVYEKKDWSKGFDVVVHDECCADVKDQNVVDRILQPHRDGLPGIVLHCGMHSYRTEGYPKSTPWFEFTGLASTGHGPQAPIEVDYESDHPIVKGLTGWKTINEELYNNSQGRLLDTAKPLARGRQAVTGQNQKQRVDNAVVAWTNQYRNTTRVFSTTLGHNNDTVADERYLNLITRGLLWSVDKLNAEYLKPADRVLMDETKP